MSDKPTKTGNRFFDWLFNTDGHAGFYVLKVWPVATIPCLLIAIVSYYVVVLLDWQESLQFFHLKHTRRLLSPAVSFFGSVVLSPAIETLLMIPVFGVLKGFINSKLGLVFLSALIWALLHSLANPIWGLSVFWAFVVYSSAFLAWSEKSATKAFWVTFAIHALNNLTAFVGSMLSAGRS